MKRMKRFWIVPVLSAIAAILAVLMASCNGSTTNAAETRQDPATTEALAAEAPTEAAPAAEEQHVIVFTPGMKLDMNPSKPIVIDFNATWCGPCRKFAPIFDAAAKKYAGKATFYSVDVDRNPALAQQFNVSGIPMMAVIRPGGKISTTVGLMSAADFDQFLSL